MPSPIASYSSRTSISRVSIPFSSSSITALRRPGCSPYTTWSSLFIRTRQLLGLAKLSNTTSVILFSSRNLAQVRLEPPSELWFTASFPAHRSLHGSSDEKGWAQSTTDALGPGDQHGKDYKPPDQRTLRLGKTLRRLSPLLPNILAQPLPNDILSPNITLHLFPSTHPHLPVVRGRVPYRAALWTAPVAWGSVPIVGNVKIDVISEKIVRTGFVSAPVADDADSDGHGEEKLVVRWRTERKPGSKSSSSSTTSPTSLSSASENGGVNRGLSVLLGGSQPLFSSSSNSTEPFTGIFVFSFDKDGRVASMTIEHADESHGCDKTSKVVTLADWLLGKARWSKLKGEQDGGLIGGPVPGLAMKFCRDVHGGYRRDPRGRLSKH